MSNPAQVRRKKYQDECRLKLHSFRNWLRHLNHSLYNDFTHDKHLAPFAGRVKARIVKYDFDAVLVRVYDPTQPDAYNWSKYYHWIYLSQISMAFGRSQVYQMLNELAVELQLKYVENKLQHTEKDIDKA